MVDLALLPDPAGRLLGRPKVSPRDKRDLKLVRYVRFDDVKVPATLKWHEAVMAQGGYPMLLNDRLGCCTCSAKRHTAQTCVAAIGGKYVPTDAETLADYEREGYRPGDPSTDQGAVERDVLSHWRADKTHGLHAFASCDADHTEIKVSLTLFGGLYIGVNLPLNAQDQTDKGFWRLKSGAGSEPGSWGGHAVNLTGFYRGGVYLVTWGEVIRASWSWLDRYCDERWALILPDFIDAAGATPQLAGKLNLPRLDADLAKIAA